MEVYRQQGAAKQLRVLKAMPAEIQGLLAEFAARDKRDQELEDAKEKRKNALR